MNKEKTPKANILLLIEDIKLQDYIALIVIGEGYAVQAYTSHIELLKNLQSTKCDLIITQYASEHINAIEICKLIREIFLLRQAPVIVILPEDDPMRKAKLIYGGADDYLTQSQITQELLLKIKTALYRVMRYQDVHPLTRLPGLTTTIKEITRKIEEKHTFAVVGAQLNYLRSINDRYGFDRGDTAITHTADIIREAIRELGSTSDFLAHLGGGTFLFFTQPESVDAICQQIIDTFNATVEKFYDIEDKTKKCIYIKSRQGILNRFPFMKLAIGATSTKHYPFSSAAQVLGIVQELTSYAGQFEKSILVKERRHYWPFH